MILLVGWHAGSSAINHPDYLAYFNELVGSEPERIVVDSDLDWGQDQKRLANRLRELKAPSVTFTPSIITSPDLLGFPPMEPSDPFAPAPGWNAVSVTQWKAMEMGRWRIEATRSNKSVWPDLVKPRERVGRGILLYYFPARPRGQ
jgi:hypothetical protein